MYLIKINFVDFLGIMEKEIAYHGKRFYGSGEDEKDRSKKWWLKKYFNSLTYVNSYHLGIAFDRCREHHDNFPSVNQLLKFCPPKQLIKPVVNGDYTGPAPITSRMRTQLKHINSGPSKIKIVQNQMDSMKRMCRGRFDGDWKETFARWDLENQKRLDVL